ncbi:MAG: hypothetical protein ABL997_18245 [Planctomycetota bacterium]
MPEAQQLDFRELKDGVLRNNVGVDRIVVALRAECEPGFATATATKQRWGLLVEPGSSASGPWHWFSVEGLDEDGELRLSWIGASSGPAERPAALPRNREPR